MLEKMMKNLGIKMKNKNMIMIGILCVVFGMLLCSYNNSKSNSFDFYETGNQGQIAQEAPVANGSPQGRMDDLLVRDEDLKGSNVPPGAVTDTQGLPEHVDLEKTNIQAGELLPKNNAASEWSESNRDPTGILTNVNLLQAGSLIGIDTVGQTLRNANLQIRSEPPNPKMDTGPWNKTTIEADPYRKSLDCN